MASATAAPDRSALAARLRALPGVPEVLSEPAELLVYESDGLTVLRGSPSLVALPITGEAVAAVVRLCCQAGVPFLARGAGTGLSGGATPVEGCVVIECSRLARVLEVDAVNRTATVEPGLVNAHLSEQVAQLELHYAPDPSSQSACTIGGNIAENSGGPHTLKYGTTSPHVLALQVVLPDGDVVRLGRRDGHAHKHARNTSCTGIRRWRRRVLLLATSLTVATSPRSRASLECYRSKRCGGDCVTAATASMDG